MGSGAQKLLFWRLGAWYFSIDVFLVFINKKKGGRVPRLVLFELFFFPRGRS